MNTRQARRTKSADPRFRYDWKIRTWVDGEVIEHPVVFHHQALVEQRFPGRWRSSYRGAANLFDDDQEPCKYIEWTPRP